MMQLSLKEWEHNDAFVTSGDGHIMMPFLPQGLVT